MPTDTVSRRLALLDGVRLSEEDRADVVAELARFDDALATLRPFAEGTPWPALPVPPYWAESRASGEPLAGDAPSAGRLDGPSVAAD